jgi:hypothetical protein
MGMLLYYKGQEILTESCPLAGFHIKDLELTDLTTAWLENNCDFLSVYILDGYG